MEDLEEYNFQQVIKILQQSNRTANECSFLLDQLLALDDFRRYYEICGYSVCLQVVKLLTLQSYKSGKTVFNKGDQSSWFYIVLKGGLDMYNVEKDQKLKKVGSVGTGKQVGERGCVRNLARSLSAISNQNTHLLALNSEDFKNLLGFDAQNLMEDKLELINTYFPYVNKLTSVQKERIAYQMERLKFKKGQQIVKAGQQNEIMYFVSYGELIVKTSQTQQCVKLTRGCCFGEEGALLGIKADFDIEVCSFYCTVFSIYRNSIYILIPDETIQTWKRNFFVKKRGREIFLNGPTLESENKQLSKSASDWQFPKASLAAKRQLKIIQSRKALPSIQTNTKKALIRNIHLEKIKHLMDNYSPESFLRMRIKSKISNSFCI